MMEGLGMVQSFANIALFMIALALGYLVIYFANREEKKLRVLGLVIGFTIITISAVAIIGKIAMRAHVCQMIKKCHKMQMRMGSGGMHDNHGWMMQEREKITPPQQAN